MLIVDNESIERLHLKNELRIQIVPLVSKTALLCTPFFLYKCIFLINDIYLFLSGYSASGHKDMGIH